MTFEIQVGGRTRNVKVRGSDVFLDGQHFHVDAAMVGHAWSLLVGPAAPVLAPPKLQRSQGGRSYEVAVVEQAAGDLIVHVNGCPVAIRSSVSGRGDRAIGERRSRAGTGAEVARRRSQRVVASMPGRITKVLVKVGDVVAARQGLVVVEAMKMENELRSPGAGTVTQVLASEGALVEANAVLVIVE